MNRCLLRTVLYNYLRGARYEKPGECDRLVYSHHAVDVTLHARWHDWLQLNWHGIFRRCCMQVGITGCRAIGMEFQDMLY